MLDIIGLYFHFYIIFGTNLLTGGPAQNCCFFPISVFRRKGISNGVETARNQLEKLFLEGKQPDGLGVHVRGLPGCPQGWGPRPLPRGHLEGPPDLFPTPTPLIYTQTSKHKLDREFRRRKPP